MVLVLSNIKDLYVGDYVCELIDIVVPSNRARASQKLQTSQVTVTIRVYDNLEAELQGGK